MNKEDTKFSSENQPNRDDKPRRGKAKNTLMLDAIREVCTGGEGEFLQRVVTYAMGQDGEIETEDMAAVPATPPNPVLLTLVLNRITPPLKATMPLIEFDFNVNAKPHEQASQVMDAVSDGVMSPDIGAMFVSSIKSMLDIEEHTELKARIEKLEAILNGESS